MTLSAGCGSAVEFTTTSPTTARPTTVFRVPQRNALSMSFILALLSRLRVRFDASGYPCVLYAGGGSRTRRGVPDSRGREFRGTCTGKPGMDVGEPSREAGPCRG